MLLALQMAGVRPGDEVISSPMSCLASNLPVINYKAKIVWADIDPRTGTMDPDDVSKKITTKTKAIIHYHWAGYPGYINEINQIARNSNVIVIEDASEAFGSEYKGKKIGNTQSDIVCFSFNPVRLPCAIEGGGISFSDKKLFNEGLLGRDYGVDRSIFRNDEGEINPNCDISMPGYGATLNNLAGYIGSFQMDFLHSLLKKQSENGEAWDIYFDKINTGHPLSKNPAIKPNYWVYSISSLQRDDLLKDFRKKGFGASKLHIRNDHYSVFSGSADSHLYGVEEFSRSVLCLPSGWWFALKDFGNVI
jgi:dTDP-4-amino-4,6-dideoxygalactose transaminase